MSEQSPGYNPDFSPENTPSVCDKCWGEHATDAHDAAQAEEERRIIEETYQARLAVELERERRYNEAKAEEKAKEPDHPELGETEYELISEVEDAFERAGCPLDKTLLNFLKEDNQEDRGGRKGSGFTQATRHIAQYGDIFPYSSERKSIDKEALRKEIEGINDTGSRIIAKMLMDRIDPYKNTDHALPELPTAREKLMVGSCTTAELYFLQKQNESWKENNESRRINVITDESGEPLMLEKIGMGDDHSCLLLREAVFGGMRLPPGSLLAVDYPPSTEGEPLKGGNNKNERAIPLKDCTGFQFLRLTTLAVPPKDRLKTFGAHLIFGEKNSMPGISDTKIEDFLRTAKYSLGQSTRLKGEPPPAPLPPHPPKDETWGDLDIM